MKKISSLRTNEEITEIYHRNVNTVFGISMLYLKNKADAEDMVQNVFYKFVDVCPSFNDKSHEKGWFVTVTKNMCKNALKAPWNSKRGEPDNIELIAYNEKFNEGSSLINAIKELSEKYKTVIYLYYYEEYTTKDIAAILNEKEGTVRAWLSRGRDKLRIKIGGDGE